MIVAVAVRAGVLLLRSPRRWRSATSVGRRLQALTRQASRCRASRSRPDRILRSPDDAAGDRPACTTEPTSRADVEATRDCSALHGRTTLPASRSRSAASPSAPPIGDATGPSRSRPTGNVPALSARRSRSASSAVDLRSGRLRSRPSSTTTPAVRVRASTGVHRRTRGPVRLATSSQAVDLRRSRSRPSDAATPHRRLRPRGLDWAGALHLGRRHGSATTGLDLASRCSTTSRSA